MAAQLAVHWLALRVERIRVRQPERKQQNFKLSFRTMSTTFRSALNLEVYFGLAALTRCRFHATLSSSIPATAWRPRRCPSPSPPSPAPAGPPVHSDHFCRLGGSLQKEER